MKLVSVITEEDSGSLCVYRCMKLVSVITEDDSGTLRIYRCIGLAYFLVSADKQKFEMCTSSFFFFSQWPSTVVDPVDI